MKPHFALLFLFTSFLYSQELEERSETDGGQFIVHQGENKTRAAMIQDAELLIRNLDQLVGEANGKAHPIVIELYPAEEGKFGAIRESLLFLPEDGNRFRFQVDVRFSEGQKYDSKKLQETLLKLMLIERGLRTTQADEIGDQIRLAPWLIDGISEAIAWHAQKSQRAIYAALRDRGGWMEIEKIIELETVEKIDPLSRELFRASSGALTMALLAQPEGKNAMNAFLREASSFEGEPLALLRKHFPDVNLGREGLEKWWLTQVTALAEPVLEQVLSIPETDQLLEKSLKIYLRDEEGRTLTYGIEAWPEVMDLEDNKDRVAAIQQATNMLTNLSFRGFPTYRPVIAGYLKTLTDLTGEERAHIAQTLKQLHIFRQAELDRHSRLIDLLDWYHLSTVQEESGAFDDYLSLKKELEKDTTPTDDPIIQYVDHMQKLFDRQKGVTRR